MRTVDVGPALLLDWLELVEAYQLAASLGHDLLAFEIGLRSPIGLRDGSGEISAKMYMVSASPGLTCAQVPPVSR